MKRLQAGAAALGVTLDAAHCERLLAYLTLLDKWNQAYNLTAVRERTAMVDYHLLDSLSALPSLHGTRVLDVGSGAGLPGIPLAIVCPERQFVLLDGNGKKTRFCVQAAGELALANITVERARVEDYRPGQPFDTVISRAFADIGRFAAAAGPLVAPGGRLVAMKGRLPEREIKGLPAGFRVNAIKPVEVPGVNAERHIVEIERDAG
ncbi:MAG TPA: 16S rRNA (guanine(527)-N(7))-methyltransferase RsmG [Gammaproteobacteria bacterium]|nr:16S rRNA (guanine(527)-N(7))-methyltransferase RsmG [Gammaproteobacteria bacterium]